jgi:hypothetical protein
MALKACFIWRTFSTVQASKISCTTDCSAHDSRPKARCNAASGRTRVLISASPCAPTRIAMKASVNFSMGVCLIVFCLIFTGSAMVSKSFSEWSLRPMATRDTDEAHPLTHPQMLTNALIDLGSVPLDPSKNS